MGIKVLSLFDGMSCGQIALDQLGIKVDTYYASEIDKYAIEIAQKNYPNTVHVGDITKLDPKDFADVDLIMGGSPCQGFSFAGKQLAFDDPRSVLFFEFIRLLKAIKPKYFLLENVRMKKEFIEVITQQVSECYPDYTNGLDLFGGRIEPILINSSLVSAQSRQRLYWTNIPEIQQPEERGIFLRDILETEPETFTAMSDKFLKRNGDRSCMIDLNKEKASNLSAMEYVKNGRQGNYLACDSSGKPKQVGKIKDGGQGNRIYSQNGKSSTLSAQSGGTAGVGNTLVETKPKQVGVAADKLPDKANVIKSNYYKSSKANFENDTSKGGKFSATGVPLESKIRNKSKTVRSGGRLSYDKHEWDSVDELHWRKLTPLECERLQTVPDNYTEGVSNTQRYKMLGNGWTVEVIKHIFKNIEQDS